MKNESSIYSIEEYDKLIKNCKKRNQFETNRMDVKFVSHDELNAILVNRKKYESGEMVQWLKIKWMQFSRGSLKMNFKWDMESNSDVKTVEFCRNKRVAEATMARLMQFEPKELYLGGLKIKGTKHKDPL